MDPNVERRWIRRRHAAIGLRSCVSLSSRESTDCSSASRTAAEIVIPCFLAIAASFFFISGEQSTEMQVFSFLMFPFSVIALFFRRKHKTS